MQVKDTGELSTRACCGSNACSAALAAQQRGHVKAHPRQRPKPQAWYLVAPGALYLRSQALKQRSHVPAQPPRAQADQPYRLSVRNFLSRRKTVT